MCQVITETKMISLLSTPETEIWALNVHVVSFHWLFLF